MENWRSVKNYEGIYEVSDAGNVRSSRRKGAPGGAIRQMTRKDGRKRVALSKGGKVTDFLVHRLVLEAFVGSCPEGMEACHSDDDPSNNRLENLRWDTHANNLSDKRRNGKMRGGQRNTATCGRGIHPWSEENIYVTPAGIGKCRECGKLAGQRYRTQGLSPDDPRHGTPLGGRRGCECDPCKVALRTYQRVTETNRTRRGNTDGS